MPSDGTAITGGIRTKATFERFFPGVDSSMCFDAALTGKTLETNVALERLFPRVYSHMPLKD